MIYCPKCGTTNRQGSRFCNECGAPLPSRTGLRCPMCGQMNPVGNIYCDHCAARLVPIQAEQPSEEEGREEADRPPVKGLSLPTISLEEEEAPLEPEPSIAPGEADWLAELRSTVDETETEEVPPFTEEVKPVETSTLLARLDAAEPAAAVEEAPAVPRPERLEHPPAVEAGEPAPLAEKAPAAAGPEIPDWLAGLEAVEPVLPAEKAPAAPEPEVPEWLGAPEVAEAVPPTEEAPAAPELQAPDWLADLETAEPVPTVQEPPAAPEPEVPEWLGEPEAAEPAMAAEAPPDVPDWLVELETGARPEPAEVLPVTPAFVAEEGREPAEGQALPDWLVDVTPGAEAEAAPTAFAVPIPEAGVPTAPPELAGLVPAEIPEWLEALRPRPEAEAIAEEPPETQGLLQGLRGTLPASPAVEMPDGAEPRAPGGSVEAAIARAQLLQELLERPVAPSRPVSEERRLRVGWIVQRVAVALLIVLAIATPMAIDLPLFGTPSAPTAENLFQTVEQEIEAGDPVLVAFEYGPADADEMDRVAEPMLSHLLNRGSRLILVSTRPEGPALAGALLDRLVPDTQEQARRVANLSYQPGQATGVLGLLASLDTLTEINTGMPAAQVEAMEGVHTGADAAMVVVLAAQPDDLRTWVEQSSAYNPDLPLAAGVSARVEPLAAPYLNPRVGQLEGRMVAGLVGAAVYEAQLGTSKQAAFYLNSLGMAQLVVVGLMLVGGVVFLLGGRGQ